MQYYINKDELQYFVYDGISSADFSIIIAKTNQLSSPERNIEVIEVDGRNEPLLIDKGNYNPFKLDMECYIDAENSNIYEISRGIKRWLQKDFKFRQLVLSDESNYYYDAVCINKLDIEEIISLLGEFKLSFLCKPLKRQIIESSIIITSNTCIHNESLPSKPYIKIIGDGDITININNQNIILRDVDEFIELDSELYNCFKGFVNQNNKMYSDFPELETGLNNISWTGNVSKIEIIPRWVAL